MRRNVVLALCHEGDEARPKFHWTEIFAVTFPSPVDSVEDQAKDWANELVKKYNLTSGSRTGAKKRVLLSVEVRAEEAGK